MELPHEELIEPRLAPLRDEISARIKLIYDEAQLTPSEIAKFFINEVMGICNKRKVKMSFFPNHLLTLLLACRKTGRTNNKQIRKILMEYE